MKTFTRNNFLNLLMSAIACFGLFFFVTSVWVCWRASFMALPDALRLIWIPNLPFFSLGLFIIHVGAKRLYERLSILILAMPILFIYGIMGLWEITVTLSGQSWFFLDANLLGIIEILLSLLIFIAWIIALKFKKIKAYRIFI